LGHDITDAQIVKKMLQVVPEHLEQIAYSIETLLDVNELSVEEVVSRLRTIEQRKKKPASTGASSNVDKQGRLLLTEEEWMARLKLRESGDGSGSGKRGKMRRGRGGGSGGGCDGKAQDGSGKPQERNPDKCTNCGIKGHYAKDCRKPKREQKAHVAEVEEQQALMMATTSTIAKPSTVSAQSSTRVEIHEAEVFAELGPRIDKDARRWVLDTGATNHMTGSPSAFAHLDTNVIGMVRFGDGSVVEIEGRGSIIFVLKNGEHRTLAGVYYIPRLVANIVSLGQMEEAEYHIDLYDGALRIYDEARDLLTKVPRGNTRLYILELVIGRPVCLAARSSEAAWQWHERFGHISFKSLRSLATKQMVRGLPHLDDIDQVCDSCLAGKQRRTPFPSQAKRRAEHALDLVHGDLCGPVSPPTPSGNKFFLLLVDDMSRYMWLHLLSSKNQAAAAIKNFQGAVEVESGRKLKVLRTDRGGSSPPSSSANTVRVMACSGSSLPRTVRNKTGWWRAVTKQSSAWRVRS
jgi:hypothetical protein